MKRQNCDLHKTTACAGVAAFTLNVTRKIDVNTRDGVGNTPIVYAILGGNMEAARELRLLGAKLDGICRVGVFGDLDIDNFLSEWGVSTSSCRNEN